MHTFYIENIDNKLIALSPEESKHAIRVMRLKIGDEVGIVDGKGNQSIGIINSVHQKKTIIKIVDREFHEPSKFKLHIAISPTKSIDRFEWFLEKATEIGISEITPLLTDNSERKIIKPVRLQKILIAAMKQSQRAYLPKLNQMIPFSEFISSSTADKKLIAHCYDTPKKLLKNIDLKNKSSIILIGAEGDFSLNEVDLAKENGYQEISLGDARLRTETAGIVACHTVNLINL